MSFGGYEDPLADVLGRRTGFYGGSQIPVQRSDLNFMEGGLGGPFASPLAPLVIQPLINSFFGSSGIMPAQFAPVQGLHDQMRAKAFFNARSAAMATASQADRETYVQMLRGMAQMRGTPWGLTEQRGANIMAGDAAYMSPILAQAMPEIFDTAHGTRGSATVMASFLHRGGIMGVDPVTGRTGVSGDSAGVLAAEMHRRFFGANVDLSGWRGISAGRAGAMYDELQTRGLMGMSIGAMTPTEQTAALMGSMTSRQDALRLLQARNPDRFNALAGGSTDINKLAADAGIATGALQELGKSGGMDTILRQFDANKIGNTLKNMSGAVAAMREIFGDLGRPDAPMTQLIEGLNKLTQGGLATMNPAELERSVRTTQVIARTSGMGMTALTGLMAQTVAAAGQMGLDPRFGISAAQGAAEFGIAYGQVGRGDVAAWGRVDADKLKVMDAQLRLNAAASPMANRLGAAMRLYESQIAAGVDMRGTPLEALAKAAQTPGASGFMLNGRMQSFNFSDTQFHEIAAGSRIREATADAILRSPAGNQEMIDRYSLGDIAKREQPAELARILLSQGFHESVVGHLAGSNLSPERTTEIARIAAAAQSQALLKMDPTLRKDNATRDRVLMEATRNAVMAQTGMSAAEFSRLFPQGQFAAMTAAGVSRIQERMAQDNTFKGYGGSLNALLDVQSQTVDARREIVAQERASDVAMGTGLSGLSTAPFLARIMDEVQNPSKGLGEAIQKILGGETTDEIFKRLATIDPNAIKGMESVGAKNRLGVAMESVVATIQEYEAIAGSKKTPEQKEKRRQELIAQIQAMRAGSSKTVPLLRETLLREGLIKPTDSQAEVNRVAQEVMDGKRAATPELKRLIGGLASMGGMANLADVRTRQEAVLAKAGITSADDIAKVLNGGSDDRLKDEHKKELKAISTATGGIDNTSADAGIATGAKIGPKELGDTAAQQALLAAELGKGLPAGEADKKAAIARRMQLGGAVLETERSISALLGSPESMRNLGPGGLVLAQGAHEKMQLRSMLAANNALDLQGVISGAIDINDPTLSSDQKNAIKQIRALSGEINTATAVMSKQMGREGGPVGTISDEEWKKYEEYRKNATRTDEAQNAELAKSIAKDLHLDGEGRKKIEQELAKAEGPTADVRRYALGKSMDARRALQEMADKRKISIADMRAEIEKGPSLKRSIVEDERARTLFKEAGIAAESDTVEGVLRTISASDASRKIAGAEAESKKASGAAKADNKVIVGNTVNVNVVSTGAPVVVASSPMGSTPTTV